MSINSTSILVNWEQPESPNGILRLYRVTYVYTSTAQSGATSVTVNTTNNFTSVVIDGLEPFTMYSVSVVGVTVGDGPSSENVTVMTNESGRCNVLYTIPIIGIMVSY